MKKTENSPTATQWKVRVLMKILVQVRNY